MSKNQKIIQYAERPLKIKLEKYSNKEYNAYYIMLHIAILILTLGYIWLLMKKKKQHSLLNENHNAVCSNMKI
jgi:hypothetical protein